MFPTTPDRSCGSRRCSRKARSKKCGCARTNVMEGGKNEGRRQTSEGRSPLESVRDFLLPAAFCLLPCGAARIVTHVSNHTGQIVWIAKMLKEGALEEVWMRTHKRHGGWKK